ncbi:MAG TPA: Gfo/Idh/MocA family oxidoreductase [Terriglobales bacterium]|nr:Gfo/Idh/MocA family oxidoreductase [Terriglobales bacterium]
MVEKTRWGIIGTGDIAKKFAAGLSVLSDAELVAVGSRAQRTADAFADSFRVAKRHNSYEGLAQDPDVDVVYVSTPHSLHKDNTMMCLRAGKAVLCEKPFAINAEEASEMIQLARDRRLFLMEAMWTRFFPLMVKLREMIASNAIGEVRMLMADFGYRSEDQNFWVFNPTYGGGGLLDVGIYPLSFAHQIFGTPNQITSVSHLQSGVDEQSAAILGYEGGRIAMICSAIRTETPQVAYLLGTKGRIHIHPPWWKPQTLTISVNGKADEVMQIPFQGNGYNYEAAEVARCLLQGKTESDIMPLDETLSIMRTMDKIRAQWKLKYPME